METMIKKKHKITTKNGDGGISCIGLKNLDENIFGKHDIIFDVIGSLDDLSAHIVELKWRIEDTIKYSSTIKDLYIIYDDVIELIKDISLTGIFKSERIEWIEEKMQIILKTQKVENNWTLFNTRLSSFCNITRVVTRKAERDFFKLLNQKKANYMIGIYLNRLSDYFFVLSRYFN